MEKNASSFTPLSMTPLTYYLNNGLNIGLSEFIKEVPKIERSEI